MPTPVIPVSPATAIGPESGPREGSPYARHIPALDGLRGLAVVAVACSHIFPGTPHSPFEKHIQDLLAFGANGVDLFFVLSGFLITGILFDSMQDQAYFRKFYARRALRIFPLYYAVLAVFFLAALRYGLNFHHQLLSLALYLQNSYLITVPIVKYSVGSELPLQHFWSLAVEEQFYLLWPITVFFIRSRRGLIACCCMFFVLCPLLRFGLYLHGTSFLAVNTNTLCRADALLAGGALALVLRGPLHDVVPRFAPWLFAGGAIATFLPALISWHTALPSPRVFLLFTSLHYSALALFSTGLLTLCLQSPFVVHAFSMSAMRFLGKYSYGIYVFHLIVFAFLGNHLRSAIATHLTSNKLLGILLTAAVSLGLTIVTAWLSYNLFERRFLRLKRFFDYRRHPDTVS